MTQSDHFRLLTQRPHLAVGGLVVSVGDGLPLPNEAWYEATKAQAQALYDAEQAPPPSPPPPPSEPIKVELASLKIALGYNLCVQVGAWINSIQDVEGKFRATTWWKESSKVRRNHPTVETFRQAMGRTQEEVDAWFAAAQAIDNA